MEFEIIEPSLCHKPAKFDKEPFLFVGSCYILLSEPACKVLGVSKGSDVLFSKKDGCFHVANTTETDRGGFRVSQWKHHKDLSVSFVGKTRNKMSLMRGMYRLSDTAVYDEKSQLDWYYLKQDE